MVCLLYFINIIITWFLSLCFPTALERSMRFRAGPGLRRVPGGPTRSALVSRFGEGAQLLGVDVLQLLQLPLGSAVQILDVHHVRLLDASVLPELVADPRDEARFVLAGPQELPVQSQDLLLQLAVPHHRTGTTSPGPEIPNGGEPNPAGSASALVQQAALWLQLSADPQSVLLRRSQTQAELPPQRAMSVKLEPLTDHRGP